MKLILIAAMYVTCTCTVHATRHSPVKLMPLDRVVLVLTPVKEDKLPEKFPTSLETVVFFTIGEGEEIEIGVGVDADVEMERGIGVEEEEEEEDRFKLLLILILLLSVLTLPLVSSYVPLFLFPISRFSRNFSEDCKSYDGSLRYKNGLHILESVFMSNPFSLFSGARQALNKFITFDSNGLLRVRGKEGKRRGER